MKDPDGFGWPAVFWSKVRPAGDDECWIWEYTTTTGYGSYVTDGRRYLAHRTAYTLEVGTLGDNQTLIHECPERACVNPRHMRVEDRQGHPSGRNTLGWPGRFWAKVDKRGPNECWEWTANKDRVGYGHLRLNNTSAMAHRIAYELTIGPIPKGLTIDHLCRNTSCTNPAHMEPVTMRENILRGDGPAAVNARKTHCKRGHELSVENIYPNALPSRICRLCRKITADRWRARD